MFKDKLLYIKEEIDKISEINVMEKSVQERLNNSLAMYAENLEKTCRYILSQDTKKILNMLKEKRK